MLPALASGLREGGKFEVAALSYADVEAIAIAAPGADALALFYGAPALSLHAALQQFAPAVRERGARVIAVLLKDQAGLRDDCFRAGASELLFMPMPKDQFVARLSAAVALSYGGTDGSTASVSVSSLTSAATLEEAVVTAAGVHASGAIEFRSGETVQLTWLSGALAFQAWGLVVRSGAEGTQIRFAGMAPEEETRVRDWLSGGRQAPRAGPPPGFADRSPIRPTVGKKPSHPSETGADKLDTAPAPSGTQLPDTQLPDTQLPDTQLPDTQLPDTPLPDTPLPDTPLPGTATSGPAWPVPLGIAFCQVALQQMLTEKTVSADSAPELAASARKVTNALSSSERAAVEKAGPGSHFAEALATRIALGAAQSDGMRLFASQPPAAVDLAAVAALTQLADAVATKLQQEADRAIGKGEVEMLQLVTAASAALGRELLAFKETADRLRGLGTASRLGGRALDPDVQMPGQARPTSRAAAPDSSAKKPSVFKVGSEFAGSRDRRQRVAVGLAALVLVGALVNLFFFAHPRVTVVAGDSIEGAGTTIASISIVEQSALVTVNKTFFTAGLAHNLTVLCDALRPREVQKAVLLLTSGASAGTVQIETCKAFALPVQFMPATAPAALPTGPTPPQK